MLLDSPRSLREKRVFPATAFLFALFASVGVAAGVAVGIGCSGRTAPVNSGPTSSGGSTAPPNPMPANPAPPETAPPAPAPTRGATQDFARTPPTTPPGR